jgi:hypothetical protein
MTIKLHKLTTEKLRDKYLWKYLSIHKYIDFLLTSSLYLSRIDKASDLLEGKSYNEIVRHVLSSQAPFDIQTPTDELFNKIRSNLNETKSPKENRYINCMFLGDEESMAMWQIYSAPAGIVLKISPNGLIKQLANDLKSQLFTTQVEEFIMGKVEYTSLSNPKHVKYKALRKNNSYKHENEVRLLLKLKESHKDFDGLSFKLSDLKSLDMRIIAHPATLNWELNNLSEITKSYLNFSVEKSALSTTIQN